MIEDPFKEGSDACMNASPSLMYWLWLNRSIGKLIICERSSRVS